MVQCSIRREIFAFNRWTYCRPSKGKEVDVLFPQHLTWQSFSMSLQRAWLLQIFPLHWTPVASADLVTILEEGMRGWCSEKGTNKASFFHASWESNG
jgi:hypothetical protein